jgi:hypothetical protein
MRLSSLNAFQSFELRAQLHRKNDLLKSQSQNYFTRMHISQIDLHPTKGLQSSSKGTNTVDYFPYYDRRQIIIDQLILIIFSIRYFGVK